MTTRFRDIEDVAVKHGAAHTPEPATTSPASMAGLAFDQSRLLQLQQSVGNRAVVAALGLSGGTTRAEGGDGAAEGDEVAPDWTAPIEQEADTRSERGLAGLEDDHEIGPGGRGESPSASTQRQAAPAAPGPSFPTYPQIRWNATVNNAMWDAWASTLRAATATTRREQGFWVQWDNTTTRNATGAMRIVGAVTAPAIGPTVTASVNLGAVPADTGSWVTVGSFHTHTPTRYRAFGRVVGPSTADGRADTNDNVAGLVYDYTAVAGGAIPARHPTWSAARVFHSGPNSRV